MLNKMEPLELKVKRNILLNPGPGTTTYSVKMAQLVPDICHREKEFCLLLDGIRKDLVKIASKSQEDHTAVLFAGSGTAAVESVIISAIPDNKKLLVINNGAYGDRIAKIARTFGINLEEQKYSWNQGPDLERVRRAVSESGIEYIAAVHHETTSGLLNPIRKLGEIAKANGCKFIVDAMSSFAGIAFKMEENNIDYLISSANKCLQGMPGISFVIAKKDEIEKLKDGKKKCFYLDLHAQYESLEKQQQMRFTPPVQTAYALRKAIDEFFEEGAERRQERYFKSWQTLTSGLHEIGFKLLIEDERMQSRILTSVVEPKNQEYDFDRLHDRLYEKGFTIYPGKIGNMNTFRIANMGAIDYRDIENFLSALKDSLKCMGIEKLVY